MDRVVHILRLEGGVDVKTVIYIGRASPRYRLPRSVFANPYAITKTRSRAKAIERYRQMIHERPEMLEALRAFPLDEDMVFACWCKQRDREVPCHGDVLKELREQWRLERQERDML
jgi:hypothetical protein